MTIPTVDDIEARYETLLTMTLAEAQRHAQDAFRPEYEIRPQDVNEHIARNTIADALAAVPRRYVTATLADLDGAQRPDVLQVWLADQRALTLWLFGGVGTGKTYAAAALYAERIVRHAALRALGKGRPAPRFTTVAGLLDMLRRDGDDAVWDRVKSTPFLVLDDFAHIRPTEWAAERMWMLADCRVNEGLKTVITTNAGFADLKDAWGAATMDRLTEAATSVTVAGKSRRAPIDRLGTPA